MIRFTAEGKDDRTLIGLGITQVNVEELTKGRPIRVTSESLGLSEKFVILLFYGENLELLRSQLEPFIGPDTKVNVDPLLNAESGEYGKVIKPGHRRS